VATKFRIITVIRNKLVGIASAACALFPLPSPKGLRPHPGRGHVGQDVGYGDPAELFDQDLERTPVEGAQVGLDEPPGRAIGVRVVQSKDGIVPVDGAPDLAQVDLFRGPIENPSPVGAGLGPDQALVAQHPEHSTDVHRVGGRADGQGDGVDHRRRSVGQQGE
jgi:hypothetical protein